MKRQSFQILFYLRKNRKNKFGESPIYLRLTVNGEQATLSTGRNIKVRHWNPKKGLARDSYADADYINDRLKALRGQVYQVFNLLEKQGINPTPSRIVGQLSGRGNNIKTLLSAYEYHNKLMKVKIGKGISYGSYKNHRLTYRHLLKFIPTYCNSHDILLNEVNGRFISEFDHYLQVEQNNSQNGSMKNLVRLKKIILMSINHEWLSKNPFRAYKIQFVKTDRVYLNAEELSKIEAVLLPSEKLNKVRDIYIFSCYTGLAYIDIKGLKNENIITGIDGKKWLLGKRGKSGIRFTLPLLPKALEVLIKYNPSDREVKHDSSLFPVMSNQKTNDYLKDICKIAGIRKKISFHSARHTFATTVTLVNGVPIETVSKMLGHTDISTTQIYARVIDQKIADDMKVLQEKLL